MNIEISDLVAKCLQRMITDEIENQNNWYNEDKDKTRLKIVKEMEQLSDNLVEQGINKFWRYF